MSDPQEITPKPTPAAEPEKHPGSPPPHHHDDHAFHPSKHRDHTVISPAPGTAPHLNPGAVPLE